MDKIKWCRKKGLKFIEPNENLSDEYFDNAEETLRLLNQIKDSGSNIWLATQKYYTEYFAAYSILMKIGIKSEIHSCTIEIIKLLENLSLIDFGFFEILIKDKNLRIDNQYYLKNIPVDVDFDKMSELLLNVKTFLDSITNETVKHIREKIKAMLN